MKLLQKDMNSLYVVAFFCGTLVFYLPAFAQKGSGLQNFINAENLRKAKRYDAALKEYSSALKAEPEVADYWYGMAECWWEMKNPDKALETLAEATKVKKDFAKGYEFAGKILETTKQFDKAADQYAFAFEHYKDANKRIEMVLKSAVLYNQVRQHDKTLALLAKAKELQPDHHDLNYLEAKTLNHQKEYQKTIEVLTAFLPKIASLPSKDIARFYYELGFAYYQLQDYPKANEAFKHADFGSFKPRVYKFSAEYFLKMADAYYKVYDFQKASEFLEQSLKIQPNYKEAISLQKEINQFDPQLMKKIRTMIDSINKEKDTDKKSRMHCELCRYQFQIKEYSAAASSAEECLRINQKNIPIIVYKSIALYKSGNLATAIYEMDKVSKVPTLPPETKAMMFFALGLMHRDNRENDSESLKSAINYFRRLNGTPFAEAARYELDLLRKGDESSEIETDIE
ncbi:MAG: tetratricopeptide repeat protein [Cytophagales bacterium]|nr:tetratricopeptide repeat protein [Bernardetiaceae bacterium]MDW8210747.1 tetratricopeptide repeat protein [Cytophagales bacterium]